MSLLFKTQNWIGLDEALSLALDEGLFPSFTESQSRQECRETLLRAYANKNFPLRIFAMDELVYTPLTDSYPGGIVNLEDIDTCLQENYGDVFEVVWSGFPEKIVDLHTVNVRRLGKDDEAEQTYLYFLTPFGEGTSAKKVNWWHLTRIDESKNFIRLHVSSLLSLFAEAKLKREKTSPSAVDKELSPKSEAAYQNIIGAMLELLVGEDKPYPKQAALVAALAAKNKSGLSESNLNRKLPECRNAYNAD